MRGNKNLTQGPSCGKRWGVGGGGSEGGLLEKSMLVDSFKLGEASS